MEEDIKIPLGQGKFAYGTLRTKSISSLIIFVHGFTGHKNEHIFFNGARFFEKHNLASFRFDLYAEAKDARKLNDSTLTLHAKDLDTVVDYFKKRYAKIFVAGHSFGGITVLLSQKQAFNKAILWDPSPNPKEITGKARYLKEIDKYYLNEWGVATTIGKEMFEQNNSLNTHKLFKNFHVPIKIIAAGNGILVDSGKKYFENANKPKSFAIVNNATHCFDEDGTEEKLFQETYDWIK
nr:alpha/beta fold hydrolase [Candidatus Levybacteria bacterium]